MTFAATAGQRHAQWPVALTGLAPEPLATDALALKAGDPIGAQRIEDAEARIALRPPEQGYAFVEVGQRDRSFQTGINISPPGV